jgi:hypothetical protein
MRVIRKLYDNLTCPRVSMLAERFVELEGTT